MASRMLSYIKRRRNKEQKEKRWKRKNLQRKNLQKKKICKFYKKMKIYQNKKTGADTSTAFQSLNATLR